MTLSQNHPNMAVKAVPAPKQTATVPVAAPLEPSQPASASSTTVHLQANQQQTPRSRFTELITAQHLSAWFLFTAALIAIGLGGLHALEPGHGKTIVAAYLVGSQGNRASRCSAGHDRYRIAYCRRIRAWSDHLVRIALHRARATLSLARRFLRDHDCGTRLLYAHASPDRHGHGSLSCPGRIPWSLDVLEAPGGRQMRMGIRSESTESLGTIRKPDSALYLGHHRRNHPMPGRADRSLERIRAAQDRPGFLPDCGLQRRTCRCSDWVWHVDGLRASLHDTPSDRRSAHQSVGFRSRPLHLSLFSVCY